MTLYSLCETAGVLRCLMILKYVIKIIFITVPILLMITTIFNCAKSLISGKVEDFKALVPFIAKKLVAALTIFFVPTIITYIFSLVGQDFTVANICFENATLENVKYYEKIEPARLALETVEQNPTASNLEKAREKINSIVSFASGETMMSYLARLSAAEIEVNEATLKTECAMKNGRYANGYCTLPPKTSFGTSKDDSSNISNLAPGDSVVDLDNSFNNNYSVVKSTISVPDYAQTVSQYKISQDSNSKYSDYCLAFAYIHAYSMYSGNNKARASDALNYTYASNFAAYTNDNKASVLAKVYSEITNGKPCVLQVNGNKQGTTRHYVTVVGFKRDVKNANDLQEKDLLILDSYDGKLESMDTSSSRFMTSGADCNKEYTGYQMFYIK